jgi:hypothetical protein
MNDFEIVGNRTRQDIFGFFEVGKAKFYSQIEAIEVSKRFNLPIKWNFNDEAFSSYNWLIEPEETISQLYIKRCEQLREKYDYLVLFYSGGADSDNILNHFIDNNIKLDEVVSIVNYEGSQDKLSVWNAEIFEVAIPNIERMRNKQPNLKHTIIDMTEIILENYKSLNFDDIYSINACWTPFTSIRGNLKMTQEHWRKLFSNGKKVGFIYGIDKPKLIIDKEQNFNFSFSCLGVTNAIPPSIQRRNSDWEFDELFYWSPDFPKIVIKQCHIIKNFFKRNGIENFEKTARYYEGTKNIKFFGDGSFILMNEDSYLKNKKLNCLIYPYWYEIPHQYRTHNLIFSQKDSWFISKMNSEQEAINWKKITKKLLIITETDYKKQNVLNNTLFSSKSYNLGK